MTEKRWKEIQQVYNEAVKTIRGCMEFEEITFSYHPDADSARRDVAGLVPELIKEVKRLRRQ
jgi:hypothetical protein